MKTGFKWQTGEDDWDQEQAAEKPASRRSVWPYILGILLLLTAAAILFHQRQKRIAEFVPPPNQLIELTCPTEQPGATANYWYDPSQDRWLDRSQLFDGINPLRVTALDENSFLVEEITDNQDGPHWRLSLWQDDTLSLLADSGARRQKTLAATDPTRRKLIFTEQNASTGLSLYYLIDLDACQSGECDLNPLPGPVIWSLDGRRTLISSLNEAEFPVTLFLGNAAAISERQLAVGVARGWLDNERFIYQPYDQPDNNEMQWVVGNIAGETLATLNTADFGDLFLPDRPNLSPRWFNSVEPNPFDPDEIMITVYGADGEGSERASSILRYNWRAKNQEQLFVTPDPFPNSQISPDGRWLIIYEKRLVDLPQYTTLILIDLVTGKKQNIDEGNIIPLGDTWSADSRWLLSLHSNLLYIIVPGDNSQQAIPLPNAPCVRARWVPF